MKKKKRFPVSVPVPLGVRVTYDGVHFVIFSRHARRVWLMLFNAPDADRPDHEYELTTEHHRIGDLWHIHVPDARAGLFYLYRMEGPSDAPHCFNSKQWLLDPYARAVAGAPDWGDPHGLRPGERPIQGRGVPKGVLVHDDFDWGDDQRPGILLEETVIYETHVRGYSAHPSANVALPGTYQGLIEKIPYIKSLGVTAVELLPIHEFNEMEYYVENGARARLRNFWGYSTLAFFAPNGRYTAGGHYGQQVRAFKELVKALHQAGLEIILDVVFNHTAEGGPQGPVYSFRGIDNDIYYMLEDNGATCRNYSGCGNTVNCNHPVVRQFILDCLRYWVVEMHVDGFRFDLASVFTRGQNGDVLEAPPLVEEIAEDPVLRGTKLIAEAWEAAGLYQVGSFPSRRWAEWNGRYRDDVRAFWRGTPGMLSALATRFVGSPDLYEKAGQTPLKSVNFISCHDGFTLYDIVSYNEKHNEANREENQDGEDHNHSRNYGHEGPTFNPHINHIRKRQQKNMLATLLLSQGMPMLLAGDEFSRTQKGNNNAYCQDNEISWVDWRLLKKHRDMLDFTRQAIAVRKAYPVLHQPRFLCAHATGSRPANISWVGPDNNEPNWETGHTLACHLYGDREHTGAVWDNADFFIIFNAGEKSVKYHLPSPPGKPWEMLLTTQERKRHYKTGHEKIKVDRLSVNVLISRR